MAQNNYNWFIGPYQDLEEEQMLFLSADYVVPGHNHPITGDEPKPPMFNDDRPDDQPPNLEEEQSDHPTEKSEQLLSSLQKRNPFRIARENAMRNQKTRRPEAFVVYGIVISVFIVMALILKSRRSK